MNSIDLLKQQHREVEKLFGRLESAQGDRRADIFVEIADAFMLHAHLEEEIFYPAVFAERTEDELREAVEEHLQAKRLIADILDLDLDDEQWTAKCSVLKEDIQHHVKEEEETLFPQVQKEFSKDRLQELGERMQARADELREEGELRNLVYDETTEAVTPA